jgi:hypothetical protein
VFIILTPTFLRVKTLTLSPVLSLTISQTIQVTRVQISSIISATNRLHLIPAVTLTENLSVINFIVSTNTIVLFSDLRTLHQTIISICFVINTTNRYISLMALAVLFDGRTSRLAEKLHPRALEVTKIVIGDSVDTTHGVVKPFAVLAPCWLGVRALAVMQFLHAFALSLAVVQVGLSVHPADRLVDLGAPALLQTRPFVLHMGA